MAKLVYGMNVSLDGCADHEKLPVPDPVLFRHFIEQVRSVSGCLYGRKLYELMRYWEGDEPSWSEDEREYASVWQATTKWVVSKTLTEVGPNTVVIDGDLEPAIRKLKAEQDGEFDVGGPALAGSLTDLGLIDEYRLYLHPVVVGEGKRFFSGPRPPLRLVRNEQIGGVVRLSYVPE